MRAEPRVRPGQHRRRGVLREPAPPDIFDDEMKKLTGLELGIIKEVKAQLDFIPDVRLVEPRTIRRDLKMRKVIDLRKR